MTKGGVIGLVANIATFLDRFDTLQNESVNKGGIAAGVNPEIEYYANLANALAYTAVDSAASSVMQIYLRDYLDHLGFSKSLADYTADSLSDYLREIWYNDQDRFYEMITDNPVSQALPNPDGFIDYSDWMDQNDPFADPSATQDTIDIPIWGRYDPLVLDLNGDGVTSIALDNSTAHFDLDGDGFAEKTGWIDGSDGFLVLDKNGNGKIDDVSELFGDQNINGFDAINRVDISRKKNIA